MSKDSPSKYYQINQRKVSKQVCNGYQYLSDKGEHEKQEYGYEQYKNLPKDEKHRLFDY